MVPTVENNSHSLLRARVSQIPSSDAASIKLLCLKALGSADKCFDESLDIDGLVKICGGMPLVLEMVGSMLRNLGNHVRACESTLEFLKDTVEKGEGDLSEKVVDVVYNTLEYDVYKDAYLDIAAYFNNWDQRTVSCIVGDVALKALQDAALVRISEEYYREERVIVHDIIQARGRKLSEGDRITDYQSLQHALQDTQRLEKLKGIWIPDCRDNGLPGTDVEFQLQPKHVELMKRSLRVLYIGYGYKLDGESNQSFLNVGSLPDGFDQLKSLRFLDFNFCSELKRLPESFGNLSALKVLNFKGSELNCLPNSFGLLSRLEELDLSYSPSLESLPQSFSRLSRLKKLNICSCSGLSRLPDGFGQLKSLTYLNMEDCFNLEMVSDDFGQLSSVCAVHAADCSRLDGKAIDKLVEMKSLMFLNIYGSHTLIERWREVKARHPLIVRRDYSDEHFQDAVSSALFDKESRFLHNDGDVYFGEWAPGEGQEVGFVLSMCDLSCPWNRAALEKVKERIVEVVKENVDIVYVCMGQNMEGTRQSLLHLPCGTRAWIAADDKSNKLLGYSIYRLGDRYGFYTRCHTLIARACLSVDEEGEKQFNDFKLDSPVTFGVEAFTDIAGGFHKFFFPQIQMENSVRW